jgi:hypothetical protein
MKREIITSYMNAYHHERGEENEGKKNPVWKI